MPNYVKIAWALAVVRGGDSTPAFYFLVVFRRYETKKSARGKKML
jgi:hypothetical protein